jgi:serine/threonine protein kinase
MLQLGKRLGDFEIVRLLGKGGMGEVYEARQLNPPRPVALKVLAPWLAQNEEALERFWQEAAVPAQLDHPGIVRIITTGKTDDGTAFYTMHLVRGISLAALIKKSSQSLPSTAAMLTTPHADTPTTSQPLLHSPHISVDIPVGEPPPGVLEAYCSDRFRFVARIGAKAARALADAHHRGYLHRDIKPSNLMIDHHDQVYLVDFGLTKALEPGGSHTQAGILRGTPWYMSPEQARGEPIDQRSDIYSLGVTLYELATEGKGPFTANRENSKAVLAQVRAGEHRPLRELAPDMPHRLADIIQKALHFKPRKRYQSMEELAGALEGVAGISAPSTVRDTKHPPKIRPRRWPLLAATAALFLIGLGLTIVALMNPDRRGGERPVDDRDDAGRPYPVMLRERAWNTPVSLLTKDNDPLWHRLVHGPGSYTPIPLGLVLNAPPSQGRAFLAIDDDPQKRGFELSLELAQGLVHLDPKAVPNTLGVFLGWREAPTPDALRPRFVLIELDERPLLTPGLNEPDGRVSILTAVVSPRVGSRAGFYDLGRPFRQPHPAVIPLRKSGKAWHKLVVRALDGVLTVTVDDNPPIALDLAELKQADPQIDSVELHGALGIWTQEGLGQFRNIQITALPSRRDKKP